jgi:hypothetical protein
MARPGAQQSRDQLAKGPGPDRTTGAWTMQGAETDSGQPLRDTNTMTKEQGKTLKKLATTMGEPFAYSPTLSAEGAEARIRILKAKLEKDQSGAQHKPK